MVDEPTAYSNSLTFRQGRAYPASFTLIRVVRQLQRCGHSRLKWFHTIPHRQRCVRYRRVRPSKCRRPRRKENTMTTTEVSAADQASVATLAQQLLAIWAYQDAD